jgi:MFS family permease
VALLEKRRFLYNHSGDFPQVILIVPSHVPNICVPKYGEKISHIPRFPQAAGSAGYGLGMFVMGLCSESFGRRRVILTCCLLTSVSHLIAPLVPDILAYTFLYFFMNFANSGLLIYSK